MYMGVLHTCMSVNYLYAWHLQNTWNWSSKGLLATTLVLGIEPKSFRSSTNDLLSHLHSSKA